MKSFPALRRVAALRVGGNVVANAADLADFPHSTPDLGFVERKPAKARSDVTTAISDESRPVLQRSDRGVTDDRQFRHIAGENVDKLKVRQFGTRINARPELRRHAGEEHMKSVLPKRCAELVGLIVFILHRNDLQAAETL